MTTRRMDCQICHTSWATSCFGCHLPMKANQRVPQNKFEGVTRSKITRLTIRRSSRDDVFMLGIDGNGEENRMAVIRSSSAVVVSSQNANREWVYRSSKHFRQGYSGRRSIRHFPHTTSSVGTTKNCNRLPFVREQRQQRVMTQLLGFGTGTVNFFALRYIRRPRRIARVWFGLSPTNRRR